ncbi:hypothetical protein HN371_19350 [Candidatus Poribacteria bacterium]|jgi:hypothetical protein|nr:hypothetical protein [Candidatus Poribacteria bacterium]MBT5712747.1 hypothetical protein [Candidatus Poribacteria bacterium]MBT7095904.1 hypothetical protein [Candidatus Poribacteria bacterium]MBT7804344.1 hypothetical protein [Candidatus Poribacteria bacterium]
MVSQPSVEELQQIARDGFGRDLSAEQAERYRGRLPVMGQAARLIDEWAARLDETAPAAVHRTPVECGNMDVTVGYSVQ